MKLFTYLSVLFASLLMLGGPTQALGQTGGAISYNWQFVSSASAFTYQGVAYIPSNVAYGNGVFLASADRHVFRSTDGITWTHTLDLRDITDRSGATIVRLSYVGGRFFGMLNYPTAAESVANPPVVISGDGSLWTAALPVENPLAFNSFTTFQADVISFKNNLFILFTRSGQAAFSENGVQWEYRDAFILSTGNKSFAVADFITAPDTSGTDAFWIAGTYLEFDGLGRTVINNAAFAKSIDGVSWELWHIGDALQDFYDIVTNNAGFFYLPINNLLNATNDVTVGADSSMMGAQKTTIGTDTDAWYTADEGLQGDITGVIAGELDFAKSTVQAGTNPLVPVQSIYVGQATGSPRGNPPITWTLQTLAQPFDIGTFTILDRPAIYGNDRYVFLAANGVHIGVRVVTAGIITDPFGGVADTPLGWKRSSFFGRYFTGNPVDSTLPFVFHEDIGYLKVYDGGNPVTGINLYSAKRKLGKLFIRNLSANWYFRSKPKGWIYHFPGTRNPQYWYDMKTKKRFLVY